MSEASEKELPSPNGETVEEIPYSEECFYPIYETVPKNEFDYSNGARVELTMMVGPMNIVREVNGKRVLIHRTKCVLIPPHDSTYD